MATTKMRRTIVYIDGFNLYYGIRQKFGRRLLWLNLNSMCTKLLKPDQELIAAKYFTARVAGTRNDPTKSQRQLEFLEALETLPNLSIIYGHYLAKRVTCRQCGANWRQPEEKMTDVNIATELLRDGFEDSFDVALLISGDSDLSRPVETLTQLYPDKRVVVAFPPARNSAELIRVAPAHFRIGRKKLADSQFPDEVKKPDGYVLRRPKEWK
jgi:uncharacterized LabA/DUF88 family protein